MSKENPAQRLKWPDQLVLSLATLFGIGFIGFIPGTASCLPAVLLFWLITSRVVFTGVALFCLVLAFLVSGRAERILAKKDSKKIVIDDFSGMLITYLFVPNAPIFIIAGFLAFRFFDILKIYPANKLEKKHGSLGVVGDDLIAGIYANFFLQGLRLLLNISL